MAESAKIAISRLQRYSKAWIYPEKLPPQASLHSSLMRLWCLIRHVDKTLCSQCAAPRILLRPSPWLPLQPLTGRWHSSVSRRCFSRLTRPQKKSPRRTQGAPEMNCAAILNTVGLTFDIVGAFLIWRFTLPFRERAGPGKRVVSGGVDLIDLAKDKGWDRLSLGGIALLVLGFALQAISGWL